MNYTLDPTHTPFSYFNVLILITSYFVLMIATCCVTVIVAKGENVYMALQQLTHPLMNAQMVHKWIWSSSAMELKHETKELWEEPIPVPPCPTQIPHGLPWMQTWGPCSEDGSQLPNQWHDPACFDILSKKGTMMNTAVHNIILILGISLKWPNTTKMFL
jgi:hypothetical protein